MIRLARDDAGNLVDEDALKFARLQVEWEKRYRSASESERQEIWNQLYIRSLFAHATAGYRNFPINVAETKKRYPDFENYLDGIAETVAYATGETNDSTFRRHLFVFGDERDQPADGLQIAEDRRWWSKLTSWLGNK